MRVTHLNSSAVLCIAIQHSRRKCAATFQSPSVQPMHCSCAALWLQWKGFGPGYHHDRPSPGGPLKHYTHCMPLDWPPANMHRLIEQGIPPDAGQAVSIVKYGKTIANRYWASHASTAHGFMYWCVTPSSLVHNLVHDGAYLMTYPMGVRHSSFCL